MISIQQLPQIVLASTLATFASIFVAPSVLAISTIFSISGTFDDNGSIMGSFTYDFDLSSYTNVNINTTSGTLLNGTIYDDSDFFTGNSDIGVAIHDLNTDVSLDLVFDPDLSDPFPEFSLSSSEEDLSDGDKRTLTLGTISAVPFDFSPSFGLLLLLTTFCVKQGIQNWFNSKL